jgi:hypothetical protein
MQRILHQGGRGEGVDQGVEEAARILDLTLGAFLQRDVPRHTAVAAEPPLVVEDGLAAHRHHPRLVVQIVPGHLDVPERQARAHRRVVHPAAGFADLGGDDVPVRTADDLLGLQPPLIGGTACDHREAQLLVLLPVPVRGQVHQALEA